MEGIIYKYTSPSKKIYIGQTTQEKRRRKTFLNLNKSYGGVKIDNARKKFSPESFSYEVIWRGKFDSVKEAQVKLDELEIYYIREYDSYRTGYNMTYGGYTTIGMKASEETRKKLSLINKGKKGTPRTEEEKRKQSELMKNLYANPEWRKKRMLIDRSEEHRKKLSENMRSVKNGMFGKKHTSAAKLKMSEARTGEKNCRYCKSCSDEQKRKLREKALIYHKNNPVSNDIRKKISKSIQIPIKQLTKSGDIIAEYNSPSVAAKELGYDASHIVKALKGKYPTAYGFVWTYKNPQDRLEDIDRNVWIGTGEATALSDKHRNVLSYHMDVIKDLPFKRCGRKRYVHKDTLIKLFKLSS